MLRKSVQLPDAASDAGGDMGPWYVGCRNNRLYAFDTDGSLLWRRRVRVPAPYVIPGMFLEAAAPYLHVGARSTLAGIGAERRFYLLHALGHQCWRAKLRDRRSVYEVTGGPCAVPIRSLLLERLGLHADADPDKVHTGFLRLEWSKLTGGFVHQVEQYETEPYPESPNIQKPQPISGRSSQS